jgi:hypothetical protein
LKLKALTAAAEPEPESDKPEPAVQSRSWVKPISSYARREIAHAEDAASYG